MPRFITMCAAAGCLLALPVSAQDAVDIEPSDQLAALKACRALQQDTERLACYDAAAGQLAEAVERGDVQVVDKGDVEEAKRGLFGFRMPKIKLFGGGDAEEADTLESTITAVRRYGRTGYTFRISDSNALWRIPSAPMRLRTPEKGDTVVFKKASMNSYFIRIDGQLGVKGTRIE